MTTAPVPEAMALTPHRIVGRVEETADTVTLDMMPETGEPKAVIPGRFNMVYVYGIGEVPVSIAGGGPDEPLRHTVRGVGAVTEAICRLGVGDVVGIRGPYGTAWPLADAHGNDVVVVAGGIGLAPLRPAILALFADRRRFGALSIVYGARTPGDLLYVSELHRWRARFDVEVEVTVDMARVDWQGDIGVVTPLLDRVDFEPSDTAAFVCGPEIMMRVVADRLVDDGVPPAKIAISLERNMKCGVGFCGHCQVGGDFVCRTGPVVGYARFADRMRMREL